MTYAWHFTNGMQLRDGTPLEVRRYEYDGDIRMCESGYHWSCDPMDALRYAPGFVLSRVCVDDIVEERYDKGVSRVREVIELHNVRDVILLWAADVAEHAVRRYYTGGSDAPQRAIDTVRAYVRGEASERDCRRAADAAHAAARATRAAYAVADAAYAAAGAAARAARAAYAAYAAVGAAYAVADAVANAAYAAADAAAHAAADAAARRLLRIRLRDVFTTYREKV